jgi:diguanylate cyclase (GGDEF)-like protein
MSSRAWAFVIGVILGGALLGAAALATPGRGETDWYAFGALVILATAAQLPKALFKAKANSGNTTSYSPALTFMFAGVILLPPSLFVLLVLIPHLADWIYERYRKSNNLPAWYHQPFNIAVHLICGLVAQLVYNYLSVQTLPLAFPPVVLGTFIAALTYALLNHLVIGLVLVLVGKVTWQESGVWEPENISADLIMLALGGTVTVLWQSSPWFVLLGLAPLVLVRRALMVPQLKQEARIDIKTGLWNARYFAELYKAEFKRAERFQRPLALIIADLDLLRNINNTYGHLAGDAVLEKIGQIIRDTVREYDIPARFGGEEFTIVLPEANADAAVALAERLRHTVQATEFRSKTTPEVIHATMSFGIAGFPADAATPMDLIHQADLAVYQAKLKGRNCVVSAAEVPQAQRSESLGRDRMVMLDYPDLYWRATTFSAGRT